MTVSLTPVGVGDLAVGDPAPVEPARCHLRHRLPRGDARLRPRAVTTRPPRPTRRGLHRILVRCRRLRHHHAHAQLESSDLPSIPFTPLFLFSATFYPGRDLPQEPCAGSWSPGHHRCTHLVRSLCFGDLNLFMLVDIAYLSAISFIGYRHAVRRTGVLLLK